MNFQSTLLLGGGIKPKIGSVQILQLDPPISIIGVSKSFSAKLHVQLFVFAMKMLIGKSRFHGIVNCFVLNLIPSVRGNTEQDSQLPKTRWEPETKSHSQKHCLIRRLGGTAWSTSVQMLRKSIYTGTCIFSRRIEQQTRPLGGYVALNVRLIGNCLHATPSAFLPIVTEIPSPKIRSEAMALC